MKGSDCLPHKGPLLVPSDDEVKCIHDALQGRSDEHAVSLLAKCGAVLNADPSWRKPLR